MTEIGKRKRAVKRAHKGLVDYCMNDVFSRAHDPRDHRDLVVELHKLVLVAYNAEMTLFQGRRRP